MPSVASELSAVQSFRSFPAPRGPSATADDAGAQPTAFAMLLDSNSPAANPPPAPPADRPARSEAPPKRDDDRRADAAQQSTPTSNGSERAKDDKDATNSAQDSTQDSADSKDAKDADKTDDTATDQKAADSTDNGAQLAAVLTADGPASPDAAAASNVAPVEPMSVPNGATVAPPAVPLASPLSRDTTQNNAAPPSDQLASIQAASNSQSANAATPAEPAEPATSTTPATPAEPADKTEPAESTRGATPATPAIPAKKAELAEENTPAESNRGATPAIPATPAKKAAATEGTAPAEGSAAKPLAKSQSEAESTQADSSNPNANPTLVAMRGEAGKDEADKNGAPQSGNAKEQSHHSTAERTPGIETGAGNTANTIKGGAETMQTLGPSMPTGQATLASMQANAAPATAAVTTAAIPLANLPIEIATQAKNGNNRFEIRLDPPELGRIDVRLDIDSNGQVTSRLVAERATTLDLLRRDAPQIERALQDAGLTTSGQGMQFSLRDQSFAGSDEGALPNATRLVLPEDDTATIEAIRQGYGRRIGLGGGIDIRV